MVDTDGIMIIAKMQQQKLMKKCIVNDGKDAITVNNIDKYCYDHHQIFDSLRKLYTEVSISNASLTFIDYLTKVLDVNYKESWKTPLVNSTNGRTSDIIADVARAELRQQNEL
jgi:hypothetical protein